MKIGDKCTVWGNETAIPAKIKALFEHGGDSYAVVESSADNAGFYYGEIDIFNISELGEDLGADFHKFVKSCKAADSRLSDKQLHKIYVAGARFTK